MKTVESIKEVSVSTEVLLEMSTNVLIERPKITRRATIVHKPEVADRYYCLFL